MRIKVTLWRTHCETHLPRAPPYAALTLEPALVRLLDLSSPKLWSPICCFSGYNSCRVERMLHLKEVYFLLHPETMAKHTMPDLAQWSHSNGNSGRSQKVRYYKEQNLLSSQYSRRKIMPSLKHLLLSWLPVQWTFRAKGNPGTSLSVPALLCYSETELQICPSASN